MRLKNFYQDYLKRRGPNDCISVYFDRGRAESLPPCIVYIYEDEIRQAAKEGGLLMEADIIKSAIYEGRAVDAMTKGQGQTIRIWKAEIDADQAEIARSRIESDPAKKPRAKRRGRFTL